MWNDWFVAPPLAYLFVAISFVGVYASIVILTRITGLRSFSKMSAPDVVMTLAVGSLFANSISSSSPPLPLAVFALVCLFAGQWAFARARGSRRLENLIANTPVLLMNDGGYLDDNMLKVHVTRADIRAKLREANVLNGQVRAVVFETTGDISVLHTSDADAELADDLLEGVALEAP